MRHETHDRRDFMKKWLLGASTAWASGAIPFAEALQPAQGDEPAVTVVTAGKRTAPLRSPWFYWGVGIENCWIAQTDPVLDGNRRLLDVFEQMQHVIKWKVDLDLVREVGFNTIRYSVPCGTRPSRNAAFTTGRGSTGPWNIWSTSSRSCRSWT
jgi:hypothetical protein